MRGIAYADVSVETFATAAVLPPEVQFLLDQRLPRDQAGSLFAGRAWWSVVLSDAMPAGSAAVFVVCKAGDHVLALVPLLRRNGIAALESLTTPYTCRYTPLFATGLDRLTRIATMAAFGRFCRIRGVTRLDALPAEWDELPDLLAGVRQAGLRPLRFNHFGNWHEDVAGMDWTSYLARRSGALRETIRRRLRQADKLPDARFAVLSTPADMAIAADAFESVYARSWKGPEPYPRFNVAFMHATAALGLLRFGVWSIGATPVAVQFWILEAGHATVLKLAHDEAFKAHSPGTVLTALMLRHLLDEEHVDQIDFGRGDDDYKQGWATQRRQRIGLLLVNPWRLSGAVELMRHISGRLRAAMRKAPAGRGSSAAPGPPRLAMDIDHDPKIERIRRESSRGDQTGPASTQ
ncbi:GNAT family N-acetyltransferase [Rhodopila sp.]|uniref:GNAT family N-acetyltransferase n=1 Tax=Rhodopila sp. TaxID=2480087 RepID=UPI003D1320B6